MKFSYRTAAMCLLLLPMLDSTPAGFSQDKSPEEKKSQVQGYITQPGYRDFNEAMLQNLRLPAGFRVDVFAKNLGNARMMAVAADGTVYLTQQEEGRVTALRDRDGDGRAEDVRTVASNLELVHGINIYENRVYLVSPTKVWMAEIEAGRRALDAAHNNQRPAGRRAAPRAQHRRRPGQDALHLGRQHM